MAKKKSKASAKSADRKSKQETKKYTIGDLAEELDINAASARVQLRRNKVKKHGGRYGWDNRTEMMEVVKLIKANAKSSKKADADDDDDDDEDDE